MWVKVWVSVQLVAAGDQAAGRQVVEVRGYMVR